jgi:hypothetical protein
MTMQNTITPTARRVSKSEPITLSSLQPRPDQVQTWLAHEKPLPFVSAAARVLEAHEQDGPRRDEVAFDLRTWAFGSSDDQTMQLVRVPLPGRAPMAPLALRELAFAQLCQRLDVPAGYLRALPRKLQVACMNWGLARQEQNGLLRLAGNEVRAIVSERYAALDDSFLLEVVDDVLAASEYRDDAVVRATSTGLHTVLRVTVPSAGVVVKKDDVIEWGLDIGNSELGLRSVQITPVTYRLVCTNGMRAWRSEASLRMRHSGDPARLRDQLRDAIPVAFAEARGDVARWQKATELLIDDALDEIETLRSFGLSNGEVQAVGRSLADDTGVMRADGTSAQALAALKSSRTTAFDVANAITATARDRKDIAARLSLEEVGHRYLVARTR